MARKIRNHTLEVRANRLRLTVAKKPIFVRIGPGISLGYRRNQTAGTWVLRRADGRGGSRMASVGVADDYDEADGSSILTYWQAQDRAKGMVRQENGSTTSAPLTVKTAAENYLAWLQNKNKNTAADTKCRLTLHFLPKFESRLVSSLTKTELDVWHSSLVTKFDNDKDEEHKEKIRRSKDSANRVLTMVKALLNHSMLDIANGIDDDRAWRHVKPFEGVARPREIRFTEKEVRRLINSAEDAAVANLLNGAYLTGGRYGEFKAARVADFNIRAKTLRLSGKTNSRPVILQSSAVEFFRRLAGKRAPTEFLFLKNDGTRWKSSDQTRPVKLALSKAKLDPRASLGTLRHTYISSAIEHNIPLNIIAENCGTSVRMIEKTYAHVLIKHRRKFIERGAPVSENSYRPQMPLG